VGLTGCNETGFTELGSLISKPLKPLQECFSLLIVSFHLIIISSSLFAFVQYILLSTPPSEMFWII
jgi:hypothetical protein